MKCEVTVIGGGVIGLSCAWKLAQRGIKVLLLERGELAREASWTAGGMIAPGCEAIHASDEDAAMSLLCHQSRDLYADFAAELYDFTGVDVELSLTGAKSTFDDWRTSGILLLGEKDHTLSWSSKNEYFDLSSLPFLSPQTYDLPALWLPDEGQVDNRKLTSALAQAARQSGVQILEDAQVHRIVCDENKISYIESAAGKVTAEKVLLCAGAWSGQIDGLPESCVPPVRPVAGQMLALRPAGGIDRIIYAKPDIYLIPRRDGRLVLGSSVEEIGFHKHTTAEHAERKFREACSIIPALRNSEIVEHWCGFRPAAPDDLPILGKSEIENLYIATGHHRNGILLAPVTADLMVENVINNASIDSAFSPLRFAKTEVKATSFCRNLRLKNPSNVQHT
jgi:glycine oxidase